MEMTTTILWALAAAGISAGIVLLFMNSRMRNRLLHKANAFNQERSLLERDKALLTQQLQEEQQRNRQLTDEKQKTADELQTALSGQREAEAGKIKALADLEAQKNLTEESRKHYEEMIKSMKETVVTNMQAETEKLLKQREEELEKGNKSTMDDILKPLQTSIENMQKAMKDNAETHIKNTTELSKQLEQAVKDMKDETSNVGKKADILSEALTGKPKVQGCFGENFLESILANEGLVKGLHYTREEANDDRSRPDFVFHFKDGMEEKDLIVDSKVSMTAFVNYMNAEDEETKKKELADHVRSVRKHINELAEKEYAKKNPKAFADYVLMFMPRDMAFRAALEADPKLWQEAYEKNVLITTEQTIIPFLKIMQLTWNKYQHDSNILEITKAASNMIERVGAFYDSYKELGKKINAVTKEYNSGIIKLRDNGTSITTSARQVMKIGVKREKGKELAAPTEMIGEVSED